MDNYNPHKTARFRPTDTMTVPARWLFEKVIEPWVMWPKSVLDYGAGKSHDASIWKQKTGAVTQGYDEHPHPGFEHRVERPTQSFDLVTMIFVLNIKDSEQERMDAILDAATFVAPGGLLWVATRSRKHIDSQGEDKGWGRTVHGSWISDPRKGTVQFGMDNDHIIELVNKCGLSDFAPLDLPGRPSSDIGCALFRKA